MITEGNEFLEARVALQGVQTLTSFLVILPFTENFSKINGSEKIVYLATFSLALMSLILFTAPIAHQRIQRQFLRISKFPRSSFLVTLGFLFYSLALTVVSGLVSQETNPQISGILVAILTFIIIMLVWWLPPAIDCVTSKKPRT